MLENLFLKDWNIQDRDFETPRLLPYILRAVIVLATNENDDTKGGIFMQDYNTIIGAIQMRLNKCPTRSVMDRFRIGSSTLICFKNPPMRIVKIITMSIQTRWPVMIFLL